MKSSSSNIKVSIVIPAFNEGEAIVKVIGDIREAMKTADYAYEILVVDDGSVDRTAELAEGEEARIIRHSENRGSGASRKTGIKAALGEWIVMIDADDTYPADAIPALLEHLPAYPQVIGDRAVEKVPGWVQCIAHHNPIQLHPIADKPHIAFMDHQADIGIDRTT